MRVYQTHPSLSVRFVVTGSELCVFWVGVCVGESESWGNGKGEREMGKKKSLDSNIRETDVFDVYACYLKAFLKPEISQYSEV